MVERVCAESATSPAHVASDTGRRRSPRSLRSLADRRGNRVDNRKNDLEEEEPNHVHRGTSGSVVGEDVVVWYQNQGTRGAICRTTRLRSRLGRTLPKPGIRSATLAEGTWSVGGSSSSPSPPLARAARRDRRGRGRAPRDRRHVGSPGTVTVDAQSDPDRMALFTGSEGVIVVAATNRPEILGPGAAAAGSLRPGIFVNPPDAQGRQAILCIHSRSVKLATDVDLEKLAAITPG